MAEKLHTDISQSKGEAKKWVFDNSSCIDSAKEPSHRKNLEDLSDSEIAEIWEEMNPYIERIEPKMLKKVFDGWKKRQNYYRQVFKEEMGNRLDEIECEEVADMFYLGTIFRDYLDSILDLKSQDRTGFQLYDSSEPETANKGKALGWYDMYNHTVNIIGDRIDTKIDFLASISHEMWHAFQKKVVDEGERSRGKLYGEEFFHYVRPEEDHEGYQSQIIEIEADIFARLVKKKLQEAMGLSPTMRQELTKTQYEPIETLKMDRGTFDRLMEGMGVKIPQKSYFNSALL